ncbi:MAG: TIGR03960 family B12-binding radical SAM protein [Corallococcus sp.]|nr:TIGR03960 family B12-binding radical SAM protein [Corallococcus sp.]MCM1360038.1 TIGR03960 family B12-binding radical SAM protein [Corallococcus sp.]
MTKLTESVQKPYRYFGGEYNTPDMSKPCDVRFCMCVADSYEVGMSNLGVRILYYLFNSMDGVVCERCFTPFADYENYLKERGLPLSSLETQTPLIDFDFVGFSMQFEMCYSNVFHMLTLAGIPVCATDRDDSFPFIVAGGPCTVNPEPMYKFFDFFFVGEGETPWPKIIEDYKAFKGTKTEFLQYLDKTYSCIYVPSLHTAEYDGDVVKTLPDRTVWRNIESDLNATFTPQTQLVPNMEIVHDRAVAELFRGCANGCRFCQAGFIYRPVRERTADNAFDLCKNLLESTGYDELSLNSLSTGDYSGLMPLLDRLLPYCEQHKVQLNLPSLRLDSFKGQMARGNRKSSLTFAPEAGTQRLRDVINKNVTDDNIFSSLEQAFMQGYSSVKLYFMLGLPTETMADVEGIADIAFRVKSLYKKVKQSGKDLRVSVSCSTFIPKPFTPFQWCAFADREDIEVKQKYLAETLRKRGINFSYNDYDSSLMEAVLARGGRSVADALYYAYLDGARFDAWSEYFRFEHYRKAFEKYGVNVSKIVGAKSPDDVLPWDFVDVGVTKEYFKREYCKALNAQSTPGCNKQCNGCGLKKYGYCKTNEGNRKLP